MSKITKANMQRYFKAFEPVSIDETAHTVRVRMTDESEDRHGETISFDGWDFTDFMENPVVLLNHNDWELPVGRVIEIIPVPGEKAYDAVVEFDVEDVEGERVWGKVARGFLKTVSVGFMNLAQDGAKLLENALLELSFVTIPANPNATVRSFKDGGLTVDDAEWLKQKAERELKHLTKFLAQHKVKSNSEEATMTKEELATAIAEALKPVNEALANLATKEDLTAVTEKVDGLQTDLTKLSDTKPGEKPGGHEGDEDEELTEEEAQAILDEFEQDLKDEFKTEDKE